MNIISINLLQDAEAVTDSLALMLQEESSMSFLKFYSRAGCS